MIGVDFVVSPLATRLYWVSKETGTPMPRFSDDDVMDYMVREAVVMKAQHDRTAAEEAQKSPKQKLAEKNQHHSDHKEWAKEMGLV